MSVRLDRLGAAPHTYQSDTDSKYRRSVHAPKKVDKKPAPTKKAKTLVPAPVIQKPARHRSKGPEVSDSEEDGHSEVEDENDDEEDESKCSPSRGHPELSF